MKSPSNSSPRDKVTKAENQTAMLSNQPNKMKSNMQYHFSAKPALAIMLASAAVYTAKVNAAEPAKPVPAVVQQLSDAQTKAAHLQGTLAQNAPLPTASQAAAPMPGMAAPAAPAAPMPGMSGAAPGAMKPSGMGDDNMMGMMNKMMPMMEKMMPMMEKMMGGMRGSSAMSPTAPAAPMSSSTMGDDKMKMADMMGMNSMAAGAGDTMPQSALPGFPGASHLYHIGATGFFLDHPEHITLTTEQQIALNKIKDQALLAMRTAERNIEKAEQELWTLTAADQPDSGKIEAKVREIEKLRVNERLTFMGAVGEAAKLLTADQRKILTGFAPPAPAVAPPAPAASATPMPMSDM